MLRALLALPLLLATSVASSAIISDYDKSTAASSGWTIAYQGGYGTSFNYESILSSIAPNSRVALASSLNAGHINYDLFAATSLSILSTRTTNNTTVFADDAYWYRNGRSLGFTLGSVISQNSADTYGVYSAGDGTADFDISWHTNDGANGNTVNGGWRSGLNSSLNSNNTWQRYVLVQGPVAAVPEPSVIALMGLGLLGFGLSRRKMKK